MPWLIELGAPPVPGFTTTTPNTLTPSTPLAPVDELSTEYAFDENGKHASEMESEQDTENLSNF